MNMLGIKLGPNYFNKRLQHLYENLHIQFQNQDVVPNDLVGLDNGFWEGERWLDIYFMQRLKMNFLKKGTYLWMQINLQ
jgi:hypothetical protein